MILGVADVMQAAWRGRGLTTETPLEPTLLRRPSPGFGGESGRPRSRRRGGMTISGTGRGMARISPRSVLEPVRSRTAAMRSATGIAMALPTSEIVRPAIEKARNSRAVRWLPQRRATPHACPSSASAPGRTARTASRGRTRRPPPAADRPCAAATNSSSVAPASTRPRPGVEPLAQLGEMAADVVREPEVDQRQLLRSAPLDLLERAVPALDVDVRRRRRWQHRAARLDPHPGRIARVERRAVEVADVVRGVARRGEDLEPGGAVARDPDVLLGHRCELAPELVERVAVEPPRAPLEPRGVDEVRRADLRDPDRSAPGARGRARPPRPRGRGGCARAAAA